MYSPFKRTLSESSTSQNVQVVHPRVYDTFLRFSHKKDDSFSRQTCQWRSASYSCLLYSCKGSVSRFWLPEPTKFPILRGCTMQVLPIKAFRDSLHWPGLIKKTNHQQSWVSSPWSWLHFFINCHHGNHTNIPSVKVSNICFCTQRETAGCHVNTREASSLEVTFFPRRFQLSFPKYGNQTGISVPVSWRCAVSSSWPQTISALLYWWKGDLGEGRCMPSSPHPVDWLTWIPSETAINVCLWWW